MFGMFVTVLNRSLTTTENGEEYFVIRKLFDILYVSIPTYSLVHSKDCLKSNDTVLSERHTGCVAFAWDVNKSRE